MDDVLTGRRYSTVRNCEKFTLPNSEYADNTAVLFTSRDDVEYSLPFLLAHFLKFGLEIHVGTPEKESKSEILFVSAPNHTFTNQQTYDERNLNIIDLGNGTSYRWKVFFKTSFEFFLCLQTFVKTL